MKKLCFSLCGLLILSCFAVCGCTFKADVNTVSNGYSEENQQDNIVTTEVSNNSSILEPVDNEIKPSSETIVSNLSSDNVKQQPSIDSNIVNPDTSPQFRTLAGVPQNIVINEIELNLDVDSLSSFATKMQGIFALYEQDLSGVLLPHEVRMIVVNSLLNNDTYLELEIYNPHDVPFDILQCPIGSIRGILANSSSITIGFPGGFTTQQPKSMLYSLYGYPTAQGSLYNKFNVSTGTSNSIDYLEYGVFAEQLDCPYLFVQFDDPEKQHCCEFRYATTLYNQAYNMFNGDPTEYMEEEIIEEDFARVHEL